MQTIGERLEDARKRKGVSIREAAEATKVRGDYLQKFESNQFDIGLTDIYVRGFLKNYAAYLKLPADRVVGDYAALGHGPSRARQPSREVYGRMDLSISGADERSERSPGATADAAPAPGGPDAGARPAPAPVRVARAPGGLPPAPAVNQKLIFLGVIAVLGLVAIVLIVLIVRALSGGSSSREAERPAAAAAAAPAAMASGIGFVALHPVQLTVKRQSDGAILFSGTLEPGQRQDFPNTDLLVSTSAVEDLQLVFRGANYQIGGNGYHGPQTDLHIAPMQ